MYMNTYICILPCTYTPTPAAIDTPIQLHQNTHSLACSLAFRYIHVTCTIYLPGSTSLGAAFVSALRPAPRPQQPLGLDRYLVRGNKGEWREQIVSLHHCACGSRRYMQLLHDEGLRDKGIAINGGRLID